MSDRTACTGRSKPLPYVRRSRNYSLFNIQYSSFISKLPAQEYGLPRRFAPRARAAAGGDKVPLGCNDKRCKNCRPRMSLRTSAHTGVAIRSPKISIIAKRYHNCQFSYCISSTSQSGFALLGCHLNCQLSITQKLPAQGPTHGSDPTVLFDGAS